LVFGDAVSKYQVAVTARIWKGRYFMIRNHLRG